MILKLNNRLEYAIAILALLVTLFIIFNITDWIVPNEINASSIPGNQGVKRVVTIYNPDTYDGSMIKNHMQKISDSGRYDSLQFIFVDAIQNNAASGRLKVSFDTDYIIYFLNEDGEFFWYINHAF